MFNPHKGGGGRIQITLKKSQSSSLANYDTANQRAYFKPYYQLISFHTCCIYCLPTMTSTIDGLYFPLCSSYPAVYPIAMSGKNDTQPPSWAPFFVFLIKFCYTICKKKKKRERCTKNHRLIGTLDQECQA